MKKVIAVLLTVVMLMNLVACSKKKDEPTETTISFYEMATFTTQLDNVNGWAGDQRALYYDDECFVVVETCIIGKQDDIYGIDNSEKDDISRVCKYSIKEENFGELIAEYDLFQFQTCDPDSFVLSGIEDIAYTPDGNLLLVYNPDFNNAIKKVQIITIDINSGEILSESEPLLAMSPDNSSTFNNRGFNYYNGNFYSISTAWDSPEVHIHKYDMELNRIETYEIDNFNDSSVTSIMYAMIIDEENFYIEAVDINGGNKTFIYNPTTNTVTPTIVTSSNIGFALWDQSGAYVSNTDGLYKALFATGELETIIDYNRCNVNRRIAGPSLFVLGVSEDKILCSKLDNEGYMYVVFYKAGTFSVKESDSNTVTEPTTTNVSSDITTITTTNGDTGEDPFEDRIPIKIADLNKYGPSNQVLDAMYEFNNSNSEYYMCLDNRYNIKNFADIDFENSYTSYIESDEYKEGMREGIVKLANTLRVDIMAGDGPDIIINAYEYSQFNNSSVMVDLNSYISSDPEFNKDDFFEAIYYTNTDGLYQIPYSADSYLITDTTDALDYAEDNYGMTLANYSKYVTEKCNGFDPITINHMNRADYFIFLFNLSRDLFIKNGKISLDNDAFREIAEYCYALPEINMNYDEYSSALWEEDFTAYFQSWGGGEFFNGRIGFALPTPDGAPIKLLCKESVGITKSCSNADAAWEFVKILFSDSIQGSYAFWPVNKDCFRAWMQLIIDDTNERSNETYPEDPTYIPPVYFEDALDNIMSIMESAESIYMEDTDIDMVLYEEITAYLVGDKPLDAIIPIIEDRCQTIMDERA